MPNNFFNCKDDICQNAWKGEGQRLSSSGLATLPPPPPLPGPVSQRNAPALGFHGPTQTWIVLLYQNPLLLLKIRKDVCSKQLNSAMHQRPKESPGVHTTKLVKSVLRVHKNTPVMVMIAICCSTPTNGHNRANRSTHPPATRKQQHPFRDLQEIAAPIQRTGGGGGG